MEKTLFQDHLSSRLEKAYELIKSNGGESLLIDAGLSHYYFLDDQTAPFRTNPNFVYFCPASGEGHLLFLNENWEKPKLLFIHPDDFWHETASLTGDYWEDSFDIQVFSTREQALQSLGALPNTILLSPDPNLKDSITPSLDNTDLITGLHWIRTQKTKYEIACIETANEMAAWGHKAAEEAFFKGQSEFHILQSYISAVGQRDHELPYGSIVALDRHSAILHYQHPKPGPGGSTFLIDAGARFQGYCADITRTYANDTAHPVFRELLRKMKTMQQELCSQVKPGVAYVDLHRSAYIKTTEILLELGVLLGSVEEHIEKNIPFNFFPHGLGHPLGIQVHDVAGKQKNSQGETVEQPKDFPFLRTLRDIQEGDVLTIEPGVYFIPILLDPMRTDKETSSLMNWSLIDELIPMGGIRIEDNVVATAEGPINLTRKYLP